MIGQGSVDSLIEYNVINLRPYFAFCKDLYPPPTEHRAVVTAESQIVLYAIKELAKHAKLDLFSYVGIHVK